MKKIYDLEERLINFAAELIKFTKTVANDYVGIHLTQQLIRSGTSPALNYGESQAAESRKDFIHKNKIVIKELKECRNNLKILEKIQYGNAKLLVNMKNECEELIAIVSAIIRNSKIKHAQQIKN